MYTPIQLKLHFLNRSANYFNSHLIITANYLQILGWECNIYYSVFNCKYIRIFAGTGYKRFVTVLGYKRFVTVLEQVSRFCPREGFFGMESVTRMNC